jgi:quercetin dioxygenase-like cupin family protein
VTYIDPVQVSPTNYRVLLENERVRVVEMSLKAGEMDETHSHPAETVYFVTGGRVRLHLPDGGTAEAEFPDGGAMWHEPWTHRVENIGTSDITAIIVEDQGSR